MAPSGERALHHRPPVVDRTPICGAPSVAMEFHPSGDVQICCANALYPVGNVRRSTLDEIWNGPRVQAIRDALEVGDMSFGCSVCRYRLTFGHGDLARDYYDNFPVREPDPDGRRWPFSLQFSLHNTCNLECVMCGADRSSKIRSRRTDLAPLPHAYDDAFFEQVVPYLEHAGAVDFSGGEPFMVREHQRIWDLLAGLAVSPTFSLTTNGTVWNDTVERVLDQFDAHIAVSVDGMQASTFEQIRVGASFDEVMANVERFRDYTNRRGTIMTMSWSLVRSNWRELGAAARFCDERGIDLKVQTVIEPGFGVQRLPTDELRQVVDTLAAEFDVLAPQLDRNRWVVDRELQRLVEELRLREDDGLRALCMEPAGPGVVDHAAAMVLDVGDRVLDDTMPVVAQAAADLRRWCGHGTVVHQVAVDRAGTVVTGPTAGLLPEGTAPANLVDLFEQVARTYGGTLWIAEEFDEGDRLVQTFWIGTPHRDVSGQPVRLVSVAEADRVTVLLALDTGFAELHGDEVPVSLSTRRDPTA